MNLGKKIFYFLLFLVCCTELSAQHKDIDFGFLIGTAQYNGDVNMTKAYHSPQPALALLFRKNYDPHYSLRLSATFGNLRESDSEFDNAYQQERDFYFDNTRIIEFSGGIEFNFFEITHEKKNHNFSPYVTFAIGAMYMEDLKWYETLDIPMGLGLKFKLAPKLELRGEWTFRKTFTDKLDQLANEAKDGYLQYKQISFNKTKDWFSILGISLLFNFSDDKAPCHIYNIRKYN